MSTQEELHEIDEDLARLRAEASELRGQVGDIGPTDAVERSTLINMADETNPRAAELEARREELLKRLGEE
jgi:hypothetical protein